MEHKVRLSTYSLIMTAVGVVIILAVAVLKTLRGDVAMASVLVAMLVAICMLALFYMPVAIGVDGDVLFVRRPLRTKLIPLAEIESCRLMQPTMAERRICGSGGWLGYWGRFSEPSIGRYFAYYGRASDCFLVRLRDGRQYLLGCDDPAAIVEAVNRRDQGQTAGN